MSVLEQVTTQAQHRALRSGVDINWTQVISALVPLLWQWIDGHMDQKVITLKWAFI
jgi:hypothetical protein